ncbi:hypothetical protein BO94DRAFT_576250 [Aspergillus sclerotioniger CBS 115572]|uniref:Uncharacterized protein n=1 Tax=Aspergillus sclerotioniger CBS 115572 TaxID=1450535 RepID=A0A317WF26_9EURO|nr:hypothetical protein BO94DRAFT_576250 [Aspergillus sclerotioniger CBS 115572]PWY83837.1 hypothetical protein BO94DRAFT_576250 [Aspergillus sclerotioniger CBS 115572]
MYSRWFARSEIEPGTIIQLKRHQWVILQTINEHESQTSPEDLVYNPGPSSTCTLLRCQRVGPYCPVQGYMRIYKQIPIAGTEVEPARTRAQQAGFCCPRELEALRVLTKKQKTSPITPRLLDTKEDKQDDTGVVPGGFVTWIVWEVVPGVRLGDPCGAPEFWAMDSSERNAMREKFKEGIMKLYRWGYYPLHGNGRNLVWHADTSTLSLTDLNHNYMYFVGFLLAGRFKGNPVWSPGIWAAWDLARPPEGCHYYLPRWDKSTEGWEW